MPALGTVARKSFDGKCTAKKVFFDGAFYLTIADADADIGSRKSLQTLFEQNCIAQNIQYIHTNIVC